MAAKSPAAQHGDLLSPARVVRDTASSGGGQRLGDGVPVDGPVTSFPDADEEHDERAASDDPPVYG